MGQLNFTATCWLKTIPTYLNGSVYDKSTMPFPLKILKDISFFKGGSTEVHRLQRPHCGSHKL